MAEDKTEPKVEATKKADPVFNEDKPYTSIISMNVSATGAYEQFGVVFDGEQKFMRLREDYDKTVHAEKRPARKRKKQEARADVRKTANPEADANKAKAEADRQAKDKVADEAARKAIDDELNPGG